VTVLDTHAWIWLVGEPQRLSTPARRHIEDEMKSGPLHVSSMSVSEVAKLSERGRLALTIGVKDWVAYCEGLPFLSFVPASNRIALESGPLPGFPSSRSGGPCHSSDGTWSRRRSCNRGSTHPYLL